MNFKLPAIPFQQAITDKAGMVSQLWNRYITDLVNRSTSSPWTVASVSKTVQTAAISATTIGEPLPAGLYSLSWYARISQAATSSSSLTVTASWTDGGVAQSYSGAAITGNTTATSQSVSLPLIHVDGGAVVQYATSYASSGATAAQYRLDVVLARVGDL